MEWLMQKARLSKADEVWLQVLIKREKGQVENFRQLREERRQLHEEMMLLLRKI